MHVEQTDLAYDGRADEGIVLVDLRADFETVSAGNATRERISLLLRHRRHARSFAEIVSAVNRDPRLDALEALKHERAVDCEVAHHGKLREWLEPDGLRKRIHERGACHSRLAIDQHGARAAHFLEAIRFVGDGCSFLAIARDGILSDIAQADDDVHGGAAVEGGLLPAPPG